MEWVDTLLGAAGAGPWGAITGLFGGMVGSVFKYFKAKQEHEQRKDEWQYEKELIELQQKGQSAEWEHETAIVTQTGSWNALNESMKHQKASGESYRWVNAIKDLFRPVLTTGLFIMTWFIYDSTVDTELQQYVVYSVVFTASTAGMWWFADRALAPPGMKNR